MGGVYTKKKNRVPILTALTDKMYPDNSNLKNHLRMLIYFPNYGRRGLAWGPKLYFSM